MGMGTLITNPTGAFRTGVDDFLEPTDSNGALVQYGVGEIWNLRANAAIDKGEALMLVAPTSTVPLSVTPMTTTGDAELFAGAAATDAAEGDIVQVIRKGFAIVKFDTSDTAAFGSVLTAPDATTGDFQIIAAPNSTDATVGLALGTEIGTTDTCWAYVGWVPFVDLII